MASSAASSIFEQGKLKVYSCEKTQNDASSPPKPLFIVTPTDQAGSYPVILFLHGFCMRNCYYRQLLGQIASHGYIVVAPQLGFSPFPSAKGDVKPAASLATNFSEHNCSSNEDIAAAAAVINWLPGALQSVLPSGVQANLRSLVLAGHSKGGHTAFALAMHKYATTSLDFSALVGIDPVAGAEVALGLQVPIPPRILTYESNSFAINIPTLIVGSGLGEERKMLILPPCAPKRLNHAEFFSESKPCSSYFVVKDYGHMDMLDDDVTEMALIACMCGGGCRGKMRRTIAGLVVAFLEAYLDGKGEDLAAVVADPSIAPATLDPVQQKLTGRMAAISRL
ncbi:hypothetical protein Taro_056644 [Colocasia esculenta]|uniref:Chlorophyllase n=1 Tax=Colocasia esculenta TaxID=4460 RepID=A0A843XU13_COLES|nr:hypothetical protein [Colocasia esculenta]